MNSMHRVRSSLVSGSQLKPGIHAFVLCVLCVSVVLPCRAAVAPVGGEFVDHTGARHLWEINTAHVLLWEGKPYVPAGVILHVPGSRTSGGNERVGVGVGVRGPVPTPTPTPTREPGDPPPISEALDLVTTHGVKDVCLVRQGGWLAGDGAADQALVDALEARGLRYGIALDARPDRPLVGYLAAPTRIEVPAGWMQPGRRLRWPIDLPGARSALYALVDLQGESVIAAGRVPVTDGRALVEVALRPSRRIFGPGASRLLVVPEREMGGPLEERPVDFWSAWEDTQQALARRLAAVKWGPGLRFFARPAAPFSLRGEAEELVPSSGGFRLQFESWLERRYSLADLNTQWALNDRPANSFAAAARLVPLWSREEHGEKTGWLLDPVSNEWYRADLRRSRFWRDLEQFRADSVRRVLGVTATLLKKAAANVPVIGQWTEYHPLFTNPEPGGGLDGLAFTAVGRGREAAIGTAAYAYAQAEESARPTWFLQLGRDPGDAGPPTSAEELRLDWNWLREIGCKGFFLDGVQVFGSSGVQEGTPEHLKTRTPEHLPLDWVRQYAESLPDSEAVATYRPAVLYFPSEVIGTGLTGRMDSGVWWLPSFANGASLALGGEIEGYWIERAPDVSPAAPGRGVTVLWSSGGPQKATFVVPDRLPVGIYDVAGRPLKQAPKRGRLQLELTSVPLQVTGLPLQSLFPMETAAQALREFEALVKAAEAQKLNVAAFRLTLKDAKTVFAPATAATAYQMIRSQLGLLRATLTPYIWIEGEAAAGHNWTGVQPDPRASAGSFLRLDRSTTSASGAYQARWAFHVGREATYEVWVAGSAPGSADTAGFTWRVDDRPPVLAFPDPAAGPAGDRYAGGLGWTRLGPVQLSPGRHTLALTVTEPARAGGYHLKVDALVLSREPFQPNGIRRPEFRLAQDVSTIGKSEESRRESPK